MFLAYAGISVFLHKVYHFAPYDTFINWLIIEASQFAGDRKMLKNTANKRQATYAAIAIQNLGSLSKVLSKQLNTV